MFLMLQKSGEITVDTIDAFATVGWSPFGVEKKDHSQYVLITKIGSLRYAHAAAVLRLQAGFRPDFVDKTFQGYFLDYIVTCTKKHEKTFCEDTGVQPGDIQEWLEAVFCFIELYLEFAVNGPEFCTPLASDFDC